MNYKENYNNGSIKPWVVEISHGRLPYTHKTTQKEKCVGKKIRHLMNGFKFYSCVNHSRLGVQAFGFQTQQASEKRNCILSNFEYWILRAEQYDMEVSENCQTF